IEHAGNGGSATGGAIYDGVTKAASKLINVTIAGNSAVGGAAGENGGGTAGSSNGGGIYSNSSPALKLGNTIVAQNSAAIGPDIAGKIASLGHNLIGKNVGFTGLVSS